ncbi:zincin-like metallopeptidase domain-containing protein [Cyanobium sp. ATX 6A2]|uniref:zincin-like metallopeptidase domain-containing protein n=1 Tax=Cyanobium sp. ATX 6A2 TaxID=2823700 RepID=UPI0020CECDDA|nr:zincin-like metallopeptidase domain-containing protein [Cyanobium sp. ATX 6A2]
MNSYPKARHHSSAWLRQACSNRSATPTDRIQLPERESIHGAAALYAAWDHEAIHASGHAPRLKRDLSGSSAPAAMPLRSWWPSWAVCSWGVHVSQLPQRPLRH